MDKQTLSWRHDMCWFSLSGRGIFVDAAETISIKQDIACFKKFRIGTLLTFHWLLLASQTVRLFCPRGYRICNLVSWPSQAACAKVRAYPSANI
jgi:hypothetical protein